MDKYLLQKTHGSYPKQRNLTQDATLHNESI